MRTVIFSVEDVRKIVQHVGLDRLMDEIIEGIAVACWEFDEQKYVVPSRDGFKYSQPHVGLLEWMPAMKTGCQAMIKVVGYHPTNPDSKQLPTILSTALTFDTKSGHLIGLVDGTFLTAIRTGAASAVASRILATPQAKVLGLIGCGAQAITQLHALSRVFDFDEVLVYDINPEASQSFLERAAFLELTDVALQVVPLENVVSSADILCTATSVALDQGPVFEDSGLRPWLHVNAVGADFPGKVELPSSLLKRSLVCPDFRLQAIKEGECQQLAENDIGPDLVELVKQPERYAWQREKTTVFDSTGWALEDHVAIDILVGYGRQLGCGISVQIESVSDDPKNPYGFIAARHVSDSPEGQTKRHRLLAARLNREQATGRCDL